MTGMNQHTHPVAIVTGASRGFGRALTAALLDRGWTVVGDARRANELASGDIPLTHQGLDAAGADRETAHLRSLLEHTGILSARDEPLARFERWLSEKLEAVTEPAVRGPVEQFATWLPDAVLG
jgi:NAD(P)-dependent dehydrogenase (short-subunit alcohol dehydrogenase family)